MKLGRFMWFMLICALIVPLPAVQAETVRVTGVEAPVEILIDDWGIAHIYAENEHDLFFAQGFNAARDRLFQLEMWRRQATGTVAEILGRKAYPSISDVARCVLGKAMTSRMLAVSVSNIAMRSKPNAMPPCGGAPYLNASNRKPKRSFASSSPMPMARNTRD